MKYEKPLLFYQRLLKILNNMKIIDVRTKKEYETGHIDEAINFDIMEMMYGRFPELSKDEEIIVYCESGNRSMMAQTFLSQSGFIKVTDGGGLPAMVGKGYMLK